MGDDQFSVLIVGLDDLGRFGIMNCPAIKSHKISQGRSSSCCIGIN